MECVIKKCEQEPDVRGFCTMHYRALLSGKDMSLRINREKQEINVVGDLAYIHLYDKIGREKELAIIDKDMVGKVSQHTWFSSRKYVVTRLAPTNKFVRLHRFVLGLETGSYPFVDHINRNPLDNRKSNLRKANYSQNGANKSTARQYKGVFFADNAAGSLTKKWRVKTQYEGQKIEVGRFETAEEAAWMYDQFASQIFGEYAALNFEYV